MTRAQPLCHCVTFPHTVGNHPASHGKPMMFAVYDIDVESFMKLLYKSIRVALTREAEGGLPYKLFVYPYITRSASERKQSNRNVQSKRVYERIVVAPPLAQRPSAC